MELSKLLKSLMMYDPKVSLPHLNITSIEVDSRKVQNGSLFVCVEGYTLDGHDFVNHAVENGAVVILAEKEIETTVPVIVVKDTKRTVAVLADTFYEQPTQKLHLIGVTGTNGKTTTTHLIEKILSYSGKKTGTIGTIGISLAGEKLDLDPSTPTTPQPDELQKGFAQMVQRGANAAVMEVSSHALDMGRVHGCDFNIAVFTNLSQDHLEYHPTMEHYLQAKGLLFSQLGNTYDKNSIKAAVLNADDDNFPYLQKITAAQSLSYGIHNQCDVMAKNIVQSEKGAKFQIVTPFGSTNIHLRLIGLFNVYNALAAASASLLSNISLEGIKQSLEKVKGVPGRIEPVHEGQPYAVIVDYAHTPDSLENVLATVKEFAERKVFVVVGCGGDRDRSKRPLMAQIAVKYGDVAVFTSDNPRSEELGGILKDMEAGVSGESFITIADRKEAIHHVIDRASEKDVIVIAGKGHETYQIIGNDVLHFDDREVARQAIKEKTQS